MHGLFPKIAATWTTGTPADSGSAAERIPKEMGRRSRKAGAMPTSQRPLSWSIQVFDEYDFVSRFVVNEFVDCAGCEQHAITSSAHALLVAQNDVSCGVFG